MPTVGDVIRAPKQVTAIGKWRTGKVPPSSFPIGKQRRLPQGSAWQWRVVEFLALDAKFRVLVRLNRDASYYSSILSMERGDVIQIICHHELHLSHLNWHCHFITGDVCDTMPGVLRDRDKMRVYEAEPSKAGDVEFDVEQSDALAIAAKRFRFDAPDEQPAQPSFL